MQIKVFPGFVARTTLAYDRDSGELAAEDQADLPGGHSTRGWLRWTKPIVIAHGDF